MTGDSKNRDCKGFKGLFPRSLPLTVPPLPGAPCIVAKGIFLVLIGDLPVLEFIFPALKAAH